MAVMSEEGKRKKALQTDSEAVRVFRLCVHFCKIIWKNEHEVLRKMWIRSGRGPFSGVLLAFADICVRIKDKLRTGWLHFQLLGSFRLVKPAICVHFSSKSFLNVHYFKKLLFAYGRIWCFVILTVWRHHFRAFVSWRCYNWLAEI